MKLVVTKPINTTFPEQSLLSKTIEVNGVLKTTGEVVI